MQFSAAAVRKTVPELLLAYSGSPPLFSNANNVPKWRRRGAVGQLEWFRQPTNLVAA